LIVDIKKQLVVLRSFYSLFGRYVHSIKENYFFMEVISAKDGRFQTYAMAPNTAYASYSPIQLLFLHRESPYGRLHPF
jgi:hypothetical protein